MKFKVGDYIKYEKIVGIELAKITRISGDRIFAKVLKGSNWHKKTVTTRNLYQSDHVWKVKYLDTPLFKKLEGLE